MAETDAERRVRESREAAEQASSSIFSWLNPFNWFSGLGGLLTMGIIGGLLYFFLGTERGRDTLLNWFPGLASRFGGEDIARVREQHPQQFERAMAILQEDNISRSNPLPTLVTRPNTLYKLLTETPDVMIGLASGQSGSALTPEQKTQLTASIGTIFRNEQQRNTLLNPPHRAKMLQLVEGFSPIRFPAGRLATFIETTGVDPTTQRAKPELFELLTAMMNPNEAQRNTAVGNYMKTNIVAALALTEGMPLTAFPEAMRPAIEQLRATTGNSVEGAQRVQTQVRAVDAVFARHRIPEENRLDALARNPTALYEVLAAGPEVVALAVSAAQRPGANGQNGGISDATKDRLKTALGQIMANEQQRNTLLDAQHRPHLLAMMEQFSPIRFPAGKLTAFVNATGFDANGRPTTEFVGFLRGMLNANEQQRNAAVGAFMLNHVEAAQTLIQGVPLTAFPVDMRPAVQQLTQATGGTVEGARRVQAVQNELHAAGSGIDQLSRQTPAQLITSLMNPDIRTVLTRNRDTLGDIYARQVREQGERASPMARFLATRGNYNNERNQYVNIRTMTEFFQFMEQNPFNRQHPALTRKMMTAIAGMVSGDSSKLLAIPPEEVAQFFGDDRNIEIVRWALHQINPSQLPEAQRNVVTTLRDNWVVSLQNSPRSMMRTMFSSVDTSSLTPEQRAIHARLLRAGLSDVLDDADSVGRLFTKMREHSEPVTCPTSRPAQTSGFVSSISAMGAIAGSGLRSAGTELYWGVRGASPEMAENRPHLEAVINALQQARVSAACSTPGIGTELFQQAAEVLARFHAQTQRRN